jgi:SAM-dependent methyltransferase
VPFRAKPLTRLAFELHRIGGQIRQLGVNRRAGKLWKNNTGATSNRAYPDYQTYLDHQRTKFDAMRSRTLHKHDERFFSGLSARIKSLPFSVAGLRVLCLAARQGTEVRAFIDGGAFAIGVDLNPGRVNNYVVTGDFHALQYAPASVDVVYSNSIDHSFNLSLLLAEVKRVLAPRGTLILEVGTGIDDGHGPGMYESFAWSDPKSLLAEILEEGFTLAAKSRFEIPWPGEQFVLRPNT